jgi:hypothetical protein
MSACGTGANFKAGTWSNFLLPAGLSWSMLPIADPDSRWPHWPPHENYAIHPKLRKVERQAKIAEVCASATVSLARKRYVSLLLGLVGCCDSELDSLARAWRGPGPGLIGWGDGGRLTRLSEEEDLKIARGSLEREGGRQEGGRQEPESPRTRPGGKETVTELREPGGTP